MWPSRKFAEWHASSIKRFDGSSAWRKRVKKTRGSQCDEEVNGESRFFVYCEDPLCNLSRMLRALPSMIFV